MAQERIQKEFEQKQNFICSADCVSKDELSDHEVQNCVDRCSIPVQKSSQLIEQEVVTFQNRLERCAMECQDTARDLLGNDTPDTAAVAKVESMLSACFDKCIDTNIHRIGELESRLKSKLSALSK